jgi:hypothetical protein
MEYTLNDTYKIFLIALDKFGINKLTDDLQVNKNTINRWKQLESIPNHYFFDLCNVLDIKIDYDKFSAKDKDQFFTSKTNVKYCLNVLSKKLKELGIDESKYTYIEPSAGDGSFFNELPINRRIGIDIEPKSEGIIKYDFLKWEPSELKKYISVGNPPFGLRGNLALKFINRSSQFSEFVAFILPQLFESDGKGSCKGRVVGMNLIHSEKIDSSFYYPNGTDVNVNVVFQIWSKNFKVESIKHSCSDYIKIYSVSDGGTPGTTRNKKMLNSCDVYLPTTCFGSENMRIYNNFEELPQRRGYGIKILQDFDLVIKSLRGIDWQSKSFKSTNGAFNLRSDLIEKSVVECGIKNPSH